MQERPEVENASFVTRVQSVATWQAMEKTIVTNVLQTDSVSQPRLVENKTERKRKN